ncbi:FAD-dependent oxidoreductase [Amycolatopsis azurea]|uniref:D-amino-acid oxidase n=1 Tax=Amycolatopsis azurea DSM 43854 TaxID=1238180 RepID=M2QLN5_9PSEU|nr:FAD-dependent oxidoreductase [Amycolatopsis azurea]EMD26767.1 D-amino-acid oxidase [Amycolatopsis azurea DSM 43854]OOC04500.1 D-amino-acid oxidase [Amycolatopsis azurea DSM 43854]
MRITVVGGGIIGLSCAHRLAGAGHDVTVITADRPGETTSAVAGGVLFPPLSVHSDQVDRWTATSVDEYRSLGAPGVSLRRGTFFIPREAPMPSWAYSMPDLDDGPGRLTFTTALIDTPVYLAWLAGQVAGLGVRTEYRTVSRLDDLDADLVVNAAGLGAGRLAGDVTVVPVGGQVVHLADPGLTEWIVDGATPVLRHVIPHGRHVVCGGTQEPGRDSVEPDPGVTADIVRRCRELVPALADAPVLGAKVGLRPFRPQVRLERDGDVVHCYGHGGAGITLAWGCADDVLALV